MRVRTLLAAAFLALVATPAQSQSFDPIHKIRHVVIIMQENRSFDTYFGTFPGADGIPMRNGVPAVCVPDPAANNCVRPYYDANDRNRGGPHSAEAAVADIDGGKMDGFVGVAERGRRGCRDVNAPNCSGGTEVMGYHDGRDLANYWRYARDFVLQDRMFEPNASWSLPQHLFMVSEWSAWCKRVGDPMSCENELQSPDYPPDFRSAVRDSGARRTGTSRLCAGPILTYLLHAQHVSWAYYVMAGTEPDCANDRDDCGAGAAESQDAGHMESAAVLRHGQARRRARQHPRPCAISTRPPPTARCPASCGSARPAV